MHSSRMRTGCSLTVCCSLLPGGEGVLPAGGVPGPGGVSAWSRGVLLGPGGVSAWSGGGFSLVQAGVLLVPGGRGSPWSQGGSPCQGGLPGPGGILQRPPPPVYRITDTCKNITLATTSLRPVKTYR